MMWVVDSFFSDVWCFCYGGIVLVLDCLLYVFRIGIRYGGNLLNFGLFDMCGFFVCGFGCGFYLINLNVNGND